MDQLKLCIEADIGRSLYSVLKALGVSCQFKANIESSRNPLYSWGAVLESVCEKVVY